MGWVLHGHLELGCWMNVRKYLIRWLGLRRIRHLSKARKVKKLKNYLKKIR
jgi:hypothetical protein